LPMTRPLLLVVHTVATNSHCFAFSDPVEDSHLELHRPQTPLDYSH
jgi:hypothetical protein